MWKLEKSRQHRIYIWVSEEKQQHIAPQESHGGTPAQGHFLIADNIVCQNSGNVTIWPFHFTTPNKQNDDPLIVV